MRALGLSVALAVLLMSATTDGMAQTDLTGNWWLEMIGPPNEISRAHGHPRYFGMLTIYVTQVSQVLTATADDGGPF